MKAALKWLQGHWTDDAASSLDKKCSHIVTGESEFLEAGPALDHLYEQLQSMLVEDEEAADAMAVAIGRLSFEQLQVVQVHALLCDSISGA